jgi:pyridoxine 4-dehydrogenase
MQLAGSGVWGRPDDPGNAVAVLREAVALGVNFLDTANAYGPRTVNQLIAAALHLYVPRIASTPLTSRLARPALRP